MLVSPQFHPSVLCDSMQPNSIDSISEFLLHGQANYQVFDLGRGVHRLSAQEFLEIENGLRPVPRPRQQHGWYGVVFWHGQHADNQFIWFLKFPVDEQGLLVSATRNHFLQIIIETMGEALIENSQKQETLPDNPYTFTPTQSQMAQYNAVAKYQLGLPASDAMQEVEQYLFAPAVMDWRNLSLQGFADFVVRLNNTQLAHPIPYDQLADEAKFALLRACDGIDIPSHLSDILLTQWNQLSASQRQEDIGLALLQALSTEVANEGLQAILNTLLSESESLNINTLSVIAARFYGQFNDVSLHQFLEHVARTDAQENYQGALFVSLFTDLAQLPMLRRQTLAVLRSPERSDALATAIGYLFAQAQGEKQ